MNENDNAYVRNRMDLKEKGTLENAYAWALQALAKIDYLAMMLDVDFPEEDSDEQKI